uniref:Putative ovule protein n=1 Tax=Solanum chacoense TaxID=4108 RepID=A0A0V0HFN7_SOLCH
MSHPNIKITYSSMQIPTENTILNLKYKVLKPIAKFHKNLNLYFYNSFETCYEIYHQLLAYSMPLLRNTEQKLTTKLT